MGDESERTGHGRRVLIVFCLGYFERHFLQNTRILIQTLNLFLLFHSRIYIQQIDKTVC